MTKLRELQEITLTYVQPDDMPAVHRELQQEVNQQIHGPDIDVVYRRFFCMMYLDLLGKTTSDEMCDYTLHNAINSYSDEDDYREYEGIEDYLECAEMLGCLFFRVDPERVPFVICEKCDDLFTDLNKRLERVKECLDRATPEQKARYEYLCCLRNRYVPLMEARWQSYVNLRTSVSNGNWSPEELWGELLGNMRYAYGRMFNRAPDSADALCHFLLGTGDVMNDSENSNPVSLQYYSAVHTPIERVLELVGILEDADLGLRNGQTFMDIGCGSGRLIGLLHLLLRDRLRCGNNKLIGVDVDPASVANGQAMQERIGGKKDMVFTKADVLDDAFDLSQADVFYLYTPFRDPKLQERMLQKLAREAEKRPITVISLYTITGKFINNEAFTKVYPANENYDEYNLRVFHSTSCLY